MVSTRTSCRSELAHASRDPASYCLLWRRSVLCGIHRDDDPSETRRHLWPCSFVPRRMRRRSAWGVLAGHGGATSSVTARAASIPCPRRRTTRCLRRWSRRRGRPTTEPVAGQLNKHAAAGWEGTEVGGGDSQASVVGTATCDGPLGHGAGCEDVDVDHEVIGTGRRPRKGLARHEDGLGEQVGLGKGDQQPSWGDGVEAAAGQQATGVGEKTAKVIGRVSMMASEFRAPLRGWRTLDVAV